MPERTIDFPLSVGDELTVKTVADVMVCNADGERLGSISRLILSRRSGAVQYAALRLEPDLQAGKNHYPVPWELFDYESDLGVYRIDLDSSTLLEAPHYSEDALLREPQLGKHVKGFYL